MSGYLLDPIVAWIRFQYGYRMNKNLHSLPSFPAITQAAGWAVTLLGVGLVCIFITGCASGPESHVVSAPPPAAQPSTMTTTTTTTTPTVVVSGQAYATAPAVSTVVVPAMQQEVVQVRPSSQHVWIAGYWTWRNERYEWMAGHWEMAPRSNSAWVAPRWERNGSSYTFYEGYWN